MQDIPKLSETLVQVLEERFPDRLPGRDTTLEDLRFKQGQVSVVRFLREQYNIQNETIHPKEN